MYPYVIPPLGYGCWPIIQPLSDGIDVINYNAPLGVPGPAGPAGPPGPAGPSASCGVVNATTVAENYQASNNNCYIGVNAEQPVVITLPLTPQSGQLIIVKVEMGPPIGNRKVTVMPPNNLTIDNKNFLVLQEPWESVTLVYSTNWFTVQ
jgi:hypothetical protein